MSIFVALALIVAVVVCAWLATWLLQQFPPPDPINRIAYAAVVVIAVLFILGILLKAFGVDIGIPTPG
jgi:heme A synthase